MLAFFPKAISRKGLLLYVICLTTVSLVFYDYAMSWWWAFIGLLEIALFFSLPGIMLKKWQHFQVDVFVKKLFWIALAIRVVWVFISYFLYQRLTGSPFEFGSADAIGYHEEAEWLSGMPWTEIWKYLFINRVGYSDSGYPLYLTILYKLYGPKIMLTRLVKALLSAYTCVLLYRLTSRSINESVGRMAAVFSALMPNLIIYCGLHLKETEMLFLIVAFLERVDFVFRSYRNNVWSISAPFVLIVFMFTFRTVLGAVAIFSFVTALVFNPNLKRKKGRKVVLTVWMFVAVAVLAGGTFVNEIEGLWRDKDTNQELKRAEQTIRGNQWAKYATGVVMAPVVFVLPLSTMVNTEQENQLVLHGGNFVRNFMGIFVLITLLSCLFLQKNWRDFALIGSFVVGYLGVVSMSGFANSERFLLPGLPCLIIMWAYGISILNAKSYRLVKYWYILVPIIEIGWAYFKIGSRGLL